MNLMLSINLSWISFSLILPNSSSYQSTMTSKTDVLLLILSNHANLPHVEFLTQFSDEQMSIIPSKVVKYDWNVPWDFIPQITDTMDGSSILPSIMAVISYLGAIFLKSFETYVAIPHSIEFSPLFIS